MAIKFPREQVLDRITFENPWWETGKVDPFYNDMRRRAYFQLFYPLVTERKIKRAVVLMGPRRVGKTVLLFHSIQELLTAGVPADNICYFSIETPLYNGIALEELVNLYLTLRKKSTAEATYIYFDEIQYLKGWELHLKSLVDSYHNVKFVVSGSAAAALKLKSRESGAGRFTDFLLPPLTFHEFIVLTDEVQLIDEVKMNVDGHIRATDIKQLNDKFLDYLNFGGYPELSLSPAIQADPGRYIRHDIVDKVLLRDLPSLYGITDVQELNSLFTYIAYNSGGEMSLEGITQHAGVAKNTVKKYLAYLEAAFLIKIIHRIDQSGKKFKRANFFKVYLTNPSLRSALFSPLTFDDPQMGNMVETAIFAQWQHDPNKQLYYARWGSGEVDMVDLDRLQKPDWCVEIKWSNQFADNLSKLKSLTSFALKHRLEDVTVTTIDIDRTVEIDGLSYEFIPASEYCYAVGRNLVENRLESGK